MKKQTRAMLKEHAHGHTVGKSVSLKSLAPGAASPEGPQNHCNKMTLIQSALIDEILKRVCTKQISPGKHLCFTISELESLSDLI